MEDRGFSNHIKVISSPEFAPLPKEWREHALYFLEEVKRGNDISDAIPPLTRNYAISTQVPELDLIGEIVTRYAHLKNDSKVLYMLIKQAKYPRYVFEPIHRLSKEGLDLFFLNDFLIDNYDQSTYYISETLVQNLARYSENYKQNLESILDKIFYVGTTKNIVELLCNLDDKGFDVTFVYTKIHGQFLLNKLSKDWITYLKTLAISGGNIDAIIDELSPLIVRADLKEVIAKTFTAYYARSNDWVAIDEMLNSSDSEIRNGCI